jgi:hypothetical protein
VISRHTVVAARLTSDKGKATLMDLLKKALVGAVIAIFIIAALFIVVIMIEIITEHYRHAAAVTVMMIGARTVVIAAPSPSRSRSASSLWLPNDRAERGRRADP